MSDYEFFFPPMVCTWSMKDNPRMLLTINIWLLSIGEKDVKRREAVRRKTAQYLLKAEALYSTYLAGNDSSEKSEVSTNCY